VPFSISAGDKYYFASHPMNLPYSGKRMALNLSVQILR
jgi:hypothetical protein